MKKNIIIAGAKEIYGAFAGDTISLGEVWSHIAISLDVNTSSPRSRPGHNNGLFQFLVDDMDNASGYFNLTDIKRTLEQGDGKLYTAVREFIPRKGKQTTKYNKINCENGEAAQGYKHDSVSFGREFVGQPFTISKEFVRCIHEGKVDYQNKVFAEQLRTYLDALGVDIENYFMTKSFVGNFAKSGGTTCKPLPLFDALGKTVNYTGEAQLNEDLLQAETGGVAPVLIGGTKLSLYADMRKFVVANNYIGLDVAKRNELMAQMGMTPMFYRSTNVGAANYKGLGSNPDRIVAIIPGAVKLVNMALNDLEFGNTPTKRLETYVDPYYGLRHDVTMRIDECAPGGPAITMQFSTVYDIIGYPDCWSDDEDFAGVTDVLCYTIECSDDGVCSIEPAAGSQLQLSEQLEKCGPGSDACEVTCEAQFNSVCQRQAVFSTSALAAGTISAVEINGMNFNLDAVYDISTEAGANGLTIALQAALNSVSQVLQVSGGWETVGGDAEYYVVGDVTLTNVKLINDGGADIDLVRAEGYYVNITDNSTVSTGADYATSTLNWTAPDATAFAGYPTASIFSSVTAGHYGVMGNFYAEYTEGGVYMLDLVDSEGCTDSYNAETLPCEGLTFQVDLTAFDDANDNDIQDVGELGLQNIKLRVYSGLTQVTLVDEIITDANGLASFNLEAGVYNVQIVTDYGAAAPRTITTVNPKVFEVEVSGTVTYSANFSEAGLIPIGPVV